MTEPDTNLDPFLRRLFAEAHDGDLEDPDATTLAEHLVGRLLGGPSTRESRIRAACVDSALRQRAFHRRRFASMRDRLARVVAGAEDPAAQFARLRRDERPSAE